MQHGSVFYGKVTKQSVPTVSKSEPVSALHASVDPRFSKRLIRASDYRGRISQQPTRPTASVHSPSVITVNSKAWSPAETSNEKPIRIPKKSCLTPSRKFRLQGLLVGLTVAAITTGTTLGVLLTRSAANCTSTENTNVACSSLNWEEMPDFVAGNGTYGNDSYTLQTPYGLYVDTDDTLYVADYGNHRVQQFLPNSVSGITVAGVTGVCGFNSSLICYPYAVFVYLQEYVYVGDGNGISVWILGTSNSSRISSSTGLGTVYALYVDQNGNIYASFSYCVIRMWTPTGTTSTIVAGGNSCGPASNLLYWQYGFTIDSSTNTIYIANGNSDTIVAWSIGASQGNIIAGQNMTYGINNNLLNYPLDVKQDQYKNLYVADSNNNRILLFCENPSNTSGRSIVGYGMMNPRNIALDSDLNLYVPSPNWNSVLKYNRIT